MTVGVQLPVDDVAPAPSRVAVSGPLGRALAWMRASTWPLLILVVALYLAPRLPDLNREVTVDETLWLGRSADFYAALATGDFAHTYQAPHPGVTTMWAGTLGFMVRFRDYPRIHPRQFSPDRNADLLLRGLQHDPLTMLVACRIAKILLQGAFFALAFLLARRVFDLAVALTGAILMAGDPFLIAHDRLLHVDGLFAITAFVSLLALLVATQTEERVDRRTLALSGCFAALAWLTRITGAALVLFTVLVLAADTWRRSRDAERRWRDALRRFVGPAVLWSGMAAAATFLFWPALWVDPIGCVRRMVSYSLTAAGEGHEYGIFFAGRTYLGDPGFWYYPVALVWRATPVMLVGLAVVAMAALLRAGSVLPPRLRWPVAITACFALMWLVLMSDGAKKFDRYVLTDFPAIDLLAAVGFVGLARWGKGRHRLLPRRLPAAALSLALLSQVLSAAFSGPYYLTYFNPALGGTTAASRDLLLGWGEGLDRAADFILSQPDGDTATVRSSVMRSSWAMFFPATVSARGNGFTARMQSVLDWYDTDYYISYVSQWQRQTGPDQITAYLGRFQPIHTIRLKNQDFVKIYDLRAIPPPSWITDGQECAFRFGDQVELVAYRDLGNTFHGLRRGDADRQLRLLFTTKPAAKRDYTVDVTLLPPVIIGQDEALTAQTRLRPAPGVNMLSAAQVGLQVPPGKTFADFNVFITVHDDATGQAIPATHLPSGRVSSGILLPPCR